LAGTAMGAGAESFRRAALTPIVLPEQPE
jgi:hypothetical protein